MHFKVTNLNTGYSDTCYHQQDIDDFKLRQGCLDEDLDIEEIDNEWDEFDEADLIHDERMLRERE